MLYFPQSVLYNFCNNKIYIHHITIFKLKKLKFLKYDNIMYTFYTYTYVNIFMHKFYFNLSKEKNLCFVYVWYIKNRNFPVIIFF